jgi:hypothetical protein
MSTSRPRAPLGLALHVLLVLGLGAASGEDGGVVVFGGEGRTAQGDWHAEASLAAGPWKPGEPVQLTVALHFADTILPGLAERRIKADRLCVLVTAERTFDAPASTT